MAVRFDGDFQLTKHELANLAHHTLPNGKSLLELALLPIQVGIVQTDESDVGLVWAIYLAEFPEYWLNAYKSLESAQNTCQKMGWRVIDIKCPQHFENKQH